MAEKNKPKKSPFLWYMPTTHGDIQLTSLGPRRTQLRAFHVTPIEEQALRILRDHALRKRRPWASQAWAKPDAFLPLESSAYRDHADGVVVELAAGLHEVSAVLAQPLKPGRKLLHAVRYKDGSIEEVWGQPQDPQAVGELPPPPSLAAGDKTIEDVVAEVHAEEPAAMQTYRTPALASAAEEKPVEKLVEKPAKKPEAGVTVAAPVVGCPMPEFERAEIRAHRVLEAFLTPDQRDDYRTLGRFVVVGADSGRRYLLASRDQPHLLAGMGGRQVFDLDRKLPICVHDWTVPAAEELLTLALMLQLPGNERFVLGLPEAQAGVDLAAAGAQAGIWA